MSGEVSGPLRGFLVHEAAISLDNLEDSGAGAGQSSYTEASPRPGIATASDLVSTTHLNVHHAQDTDMTVRVVAPGSPGVDGGGVTYRIASDAGAASNRSWNEPNEFRSYAVLKWQTGSSEQWSHATLIPMPKTGNIVALAADVTAADTLSCWTWNAKTRAWTGQVEVDDLSGGDIICGLRLSGTDRIVAFYADKSGSIGYSKFSDDEGVTWTQYGSDHGEILATSTTTRMRVVEDRNGAILLIITENDGDIGRRVSADGGHTWTTLTGTNAHAQQHDLVRMADGRLLFAYKEQTSNDGNYIILDDAYDDLDAKITAAAYAEFDSGITVSHVSLCVDDDGIIYAHLTVASSDEVIVYRSTDNAATWEEYVSRAIAATEAGVPANHRTIILATAMAGGECMALAISANASTSPGTDGSLLSFLFGGWDNLEHGAVNLGGRNLRASLAGTGTTRGSVFYASDTLDSFGWTVSGTTHSVSAGVWLFSASGTACYAEGTIAAPSAGTAATRYFFEARVSSNSGTTGIFRARRGTYAVSVTAVGTTALRVFDLIAGTQFGSDITEDLTSSDPIQVMICFADEDTVTVFYKRRSSSLWTKGPQKNGLTSGGASESIRVGVISNVTAVVIIRSIAWSESEVNHGATADPPYLDDHGWGKPLSSRPYGVRDRGGDDFISYLSASGGPMRHGQTWTVEAAHDYGVEELFPQKSPGSDRRWRSENDDSDVYFTFDLTGDASVDSRLGTSLSLGLCLVGTNFQTAYVEYQVAGSSSWTTLGTWDSTVETGLSYTLGGTSSNLVYPDTSGASARKWWRAGQWSGGVAIVDFGGTTKLRRIRWNSPGGWAPGSKFAPVLELDGVDATEPATGNLQILAPGGVLLIHLPAALQYRRLRVRVPAQTTVDGYFEIGNLILGSLVVPGRQWSRGYSWRMTPRVVTEEDDEGVLWPDRRGPETRELTVAWQDGGDLTNLRRGPHVPYLAPAAGGQALAAQHDVHWQLEALYRLTRGGTLPVVALPDCGGPSGRMVLDQDLWLYGLIQGRPQANHVVGADGKSEVYRSESLTIREQPWTRWLR